MLRRFLVTAPTLQWSIKEPPVEVKTHEQLEQFLNRLQMTCTSDFPISARLRAHDCEVDILFGLSESFVYINDVHEKRYYISIGDASGNDTVEFYLLGQHHTEWECRYLIPLASARQAVSEFFDSGHLPISIKWEKGFY